MSKDIVERLLDPTSDEHHGQLLYRIAAGEITKLRQQRDELVKATAQMIHDFGSLKAAVRNLKDQKGRHNTEVSYGRLMEVFAKIEGEK